MLEKWYKSKPYIIMLIYGKEINIYISYTQRKPFFHWEHGKKDKMKVKKIWSIIWVQSTHIGLAHSKSRCSLQFAAVSISASFSILGGSRLSVCKATRFVAYCTLYATMSVYEWMLKFWDKATCCIITICNVVIKPSTTAVESQETIHCKKQAKGCMQQRDIP